MGNKDAKLALKGHGQHVSSEILKCSPYLQSVGQIKNKAGCTAFVGQDSRQKQNVFFFFKLVVL